MDGRTRTLRPLRQPLPQSPFDPPATAGQRWLTIVLTVIFVLLLAGLAAALAALFKPAEATDSTIRSTIMTTTDQTPLPRCEYLLKREGAKGAKYML